MSDERHALVAALRQLPGVSEVAVEDGPSGEALRLRLAVGADSTAVAAAVSSVLGGRLGGAVDVAAAAPPVTVVSAPSEPAEAPRTTADEPAAAQPDQRTDEGGPAPDARPLSAALGAMAPETVLDRVRLPAEPDGRRRPALVRVQHRRRGLDVHADVTLDVAHADGAGSTRVSGSATGAATPSGSQRAVASATLRAVEELVGSALGGIRLEAETVTVVSLGPSQVAAVAVELLSAAGGERYTGAAEVRDELADAVVRATLDAVNRRIEQLLAAVEAEQPGRS